MHARAPLHRQSLVRNLVLTAVAALLVSACGSAARPAAKEAKDAIIWRVLGSWSGRGDTQTESFASDTGGLRVKWQTNQAPEGGAGAFRLIAHSAISGRPLKTVVDQRGAGQGTSYVDEEPRVFYVVVESAEVDWSFTIEEAFLGQIAAKSE